MALAIHSIGEAERARVYEEALASVRLERLELDEQAKALYQRYIEGELTLGLWPLGVVLVFELLSGFLAIECPIDRDAISVGSPVPGEPTEIASRSIRSEEHTSEL